MKTFFSLIVLLMAVAAPLAARAESEINKVNIFKEHGQSLDSAPFFLRFKYQKEVGGDWKGASFDQRKDFLEGYYNNKAKEEAAAAAKAKLLSEEERAEAKAKKEKDQALKEKKRAERLEDKEKARVQKEQEKHYRELEKERAKKLREFKSHQRQRRHGGGPPQM